jgi:MerR HTH family regulatory protein
VGEERTWRVVGIGRRGYAVGRHRPRLYKVCVATRSSAKSSDPLTIKDAAAIIGVSEMTLRRWDAAGKFKARRHPVNGYRLYDRERVLKLRKQIVSGERAA